jgi:O-antigen/teichoic acid export membrane protein
VILALLTWILHFGNRFVLGLHGTEIVGVFSAAFGLASKPAIVATGLISNVARPVLFNAESAGRTASARKIFLIWFGVALMAGAAVALGVLLLTPWLTRTLLAVEYRPGAEAVILWIVVGYCIYGLVNVIENRIMSFNRSASLIAPVAVGAIVTLGLNFLLIPRHGSLGAAYASAGGFAAQFLATLLALLRLPAHDTAGTPEPAHT